MTILIVGFSTRAIAESAVQGGYPVVTIDYFGDRDQREQVENHSLSRDFNSSFSAAALFRVSKRMRFESVVYIANLENHPATVQAFAGCAHLLGNTPEVLDRVRDWHQLRQTCHEDDLPAALTFFRGEENQASREYPWILKPMRGGGGRSIRIWNGKPLDQNYLLQRYLVGRPGSAAFAADGRNCVLLGVCEQFIGWKELGCGGFTWCGNLLPLQIETAAWAPFLAKLQTMTARLTERFCLRGVNGIDFIVEDKAPGCPCPVLVEVNPRYTASMELMERAYGLNIFSMHLDALAGRLPEFSLLQEIGRPFLGKGVVFARQTLTVPANLRGIEHDRRDLPYPGDQIKAGHPICTVFATGADRQSCLNKLLANANEVRRELGDATEI